MGVDKSAEALRLSEERYALAMKGTGSGHWDWLIPTDQYYVSPRFLEMHGLPADTKVARRADLVSRVPFHPEDREKWQQALAAFFAGRNSRFEMEIRLLIDGEIRWMHAIGLMMRDAAGAPLRWSGSTIDITDRKKAEEALRQSQERYARVLEASNEGIWEWDIATDEIFLSDRARFLWAVPPGTKVRTRAELKRCGGFHPDDLRRTEDEISASRASGARGFDMEYRVFDLAGETRWIRSQGKLFRSEDGRRVMTGSLTDITDRKRGEQELHRSAQRYALAMEAAQDAHWDWNMVTDEYYISPRTFALYGFAPNTVIAKRADFLAISPFLKEDGDAWSAATAALFAGDGSRLSMDLRASVRGEIRWIHLNSVCIRDAAGKPVRWCGTSRDITERKNAEEDLRVSEERYAVAMRASGVGHWDWKIPSDEFYASPRWREIAGFPPDEDLGGREAVLARYPFHPEDRPKYQAAVAAHFAGATPRVDIEVRILPHGQLQWVKLVGMCWRDAAGAPIRFAGSMQDVTERRQAEEELKRVEQQLRQGQRLEAMGTLAGGIAHDFNNILGAILGYSEMALRSARKGTRLRRDLDSVMVAGERGRALVERILAFSRSGVGERVAVHVEKVVREALGLLSASLPPKVRIESSLRGGRAAILGDPTQVHQVVMNIATNGIQAMAGTGGVLGVSLQARRIATPRLATTGKIAAGEWIVLRMTDSGTGIAAEIVDRIFDPFFTTKEVGVGTGLGLSLVHGIVSELGGAIDVESKVGKGSTFAVYLPRAGDAIEAADAAKAAVPRGERQRVLVVDDEEPLVRLATRTLRDLGYQPIGFTSSAAALAAFRADPHRFDVMVTDERMPGMSGSSLIRQVRAISRDVPILLVSGYVGRDVAQRAHESGANEVLKKPLSARDLAASLARLLRL